MFSQLLLTSVLSRLAVADNLSLWLGPACTGADEGYTDPLPLGKCIEFNQAQSFILKKDDGNVYNLYSGGGCAQYVGQVSLGGTCQDIGDTATAIMNIGPQDGKRWIRPIVPTRENSLRGPKFEWAAQQQWSVPLFSWAAAGTSQLPHWDVPLGCPMYLGHPSSVTSRCQTKADFLLYSAWVGICYYENMHKTQGFLFLYGAPRNLKKIVLHLLIGCS
ncbi:hypothetical protein GGX14DRAFT_402126 [Mycena pura]|uniref:Uncharacterized protein n=1 Tax=Mycena pura TaxID=153505 RepID=A0AAD6Y5R6_9AGAR|nr:hypothetical protein GGX14DRAFT_402126 [Mycena pura]